MIGSTPTVPISIALVAGGLAVINACGFPLLPAFLSFYLGADERRLPPAPTRVLQGLLVGALVTVGFLGFFALVGLFLTLVGASLSGGGKITTFLAYGAGMAVVLMALSVLVALAREGAARAVRPLLPYMNRLAGLLLLASGGYLFYYWARLRFGDTATVADDPIVSFGVRFSGQARNFADGNGSLILVGAAVIVALAVFASLWQRRRRAISARLVRQ